MTTSIYPGTIPVHSMSHSTYTFPALVTVALCKALGVPFYGPDPTCTHCRKRRRDRATGRLIEGQACGREALWAAVWMPYRGCSTLSLIYKPAVLLCAARAAQKAKRVPLRMLETPEQYHAYRSEIGAFREWNDRDLRRRQEEALAVIARRNAEREREILERDGRLLRMSGYAGRLFALADGSLQCELHDGTIATPCCWAEGARMIDNRAGGQSAVRHSPQCQKAVASAT